MSIQLECVRDILTNLKSYGVTGVCAGGAARDIFLGEKPKDYDILLIGTDGLPAESVVAAIQDSTGARHVDELCGEDLGPDYGTGARERGVLHVWEVRDGLRLLTLQFIMYNADTEKSYRGDPYFAVQDHDCNLNQAWLEDVNGKLRPRTTEEFPSPFTGNVNAFRPDTCYERKAYIRDKFPSFQHKF